MAEVAPPAEAERAGEALTRLLARPDLCLRGDVAITTAGSDAGDQVVCLQGGGTSAEFAGGIELIKTAKGEWLVASQARLPGFIAYDDGTREVSSIAFEQEPISDAKIRSDLLPLLQEGKLARALGVARLTRSADAASGKVTLAGELPSRLASRASAGMAAMLEPKVMRLTGAIELDKEGNVRSLKITVARSDPFAAVRRRALESGGSIRTLDPAEEDDEPPVAGATWTCRLEVAPEPSKRTRAALDQMRALVATGER